MAFTRTRRLHTLLIALACSAACSGGGVLSVKSTPYDDYAAMLRASGAAASTMGQQWQAAGAAAMNSAAPVASPFAEAGYFPADRPMAVAWQLELERGRTLAIDVRFETSEPGRLFVDLFRRERDGELRRVASLQPEATTLEYSVDRTAMFVLRVQPELLRSGRFILTERTLSALRTFPVSGLTHRAVQSGFGAARDAGTRSHEGVDIFAARGTPVVAVADGVARTDTNTLGGNVVWLRDGLFAGSTYYYAHLDRWAIDGSTRVRQGDVLGYVGNTGNARSTTPHLHFGVYDDGAIDPAPFIRPDDTAPTAADAVPALGTLVRTRAARTPLREGPSATAPQRLLLDAETAGRRLGVVGAWHRVLLPDGVVGYVAASSVVDATPLPTRQRLRNELALREKPLINAPVVETLAVGSEVARLGRFQQFDLLRAASGAEGWGERTP